MTLSFGANHTVRVNPESRHVHDRKRGNLLVWTSILDGFLHTNNVH